MSESPSTHLPMANKDQYFPPFVSFILSFYFFVQMFTNKARTSRHFFPDFFRKYAVQEEVNTAGLRLLSLGKACSQS